MVVRGAYLDPNTNIRYDTNNADFEGRNGSLIHLDINHLS